MIQRIQTVYIFLATVLGIVAMCFSIGRFPAMEGVPEGTLYNYMATCGDERAYTPWFALAVLLVIPILLNALSIGLYKTRALQMRTLSLSMVLLVGYYAALVALVLLRKGDSSFAPTVFTGFPLVCLILDYLAFRAILKDDILVKSLDRLR